MSTYKRDPVTGNLIPIANKSVIMTGATSNANGTAGNVPAPVAGDENKVLKGNGSWGGLNAFTGATSSTAGTVGQVPQPAAGEQNKFLTGGGIWTPDTANLTTTFTSSDNATETGIIVASGETSMTKLTSGDTHGGLFGLISKSVLNTRKLINTVKRVWNSVGATWVSGHAYAVNDMVVYENGHVYKCKSAHTSSASILPTNTTYWTDTTLAAEIASLNSNYANISTYQGTWVTVWKWGRLCVIAFKNGLSSTSSPVETLPTLYRPAYVVQRAGIAGNSYSYQNAIVRIDLDGKITSYNASQWQGLQIAYISAS